MLVADVLLRTLTSYEMFALLVGPSLQILALFLR